MGCILYECYYVSGQDSSVHGIVGTEIKNQNDHQVHDKCHKRNHEKQGLEHTNVHVIELLVHLLEFLLFKVLPYKGLDDRNSHQDFP